MTARQFFPLAASLALLAAGCAKSGPQAELEQARVQFVQANYLESLELFRTIRKDYPELAEAAYGVGRAAHQLHLYDEAIEAYEKALELDPENTAYWEGYTEVLRWGGVLKGRGEWLRTLWDRRQEALVAAPLSTWVLENVRGGAQELGKQNEVMELIERLQQESPNPIREAKLEEFRSKEGRIRRDPEVKAEFHKQIRAQVGELLGDEESWDSLSAEQLYRLTTAANLLEEKEVKSKLIARLDAMPEGRRLANQIVYWDVLISIAPRFDPQARRPVHKPATERLRLLDEAGIDRYIPDWEDQNTGYYARLLESRLNAWVDLLSESETAAPHQLDELLVLHGEVRRRDTWDGAVHASRVIDLLLEKDVKLEAAEELAEASIRDLEDDRPGLIYPGRLGRVREEVKESATAGYLRQLGLVQEKLEKLAEAEKSLRLASDLAPTPTNLEALGEFLRRQERLEEAYPALLDAAAAGAVRRGSVLEPAKKRLTAVAAEAGISVERLESDLEARSAHFRKRYEEKLVDVIEEEKAPAFRLTDLKGNEWSLEKLKGKVVVLNYWATWCGPCIQELPHYSALVKEYRPHEEVVFLAVSTDTEKETVKQWLEEQGYTFTVLMDQGTEADYKVVGIPTTVIVDKEGMIRFREVGFGGEQAYLETMRLRIEALRSR